jgi:DNA-binding response OmpR family regulator
MATRILIVDPDPDTRLLYRFALSEFVAEYIEAEDGAEALGRALSSPPDLVVTEHRLSRVSGPDLCAILREEPLTASAATVLVSSAPDVAAITDGRAAAPDAVLRKPCAPDVLAATVRGLLRDLPRESAPAPAAVSPATPSGKRRVMSRAHQRSTTAAPPTAAPTLQCPRCDSGLVYHHTAVGGVNERFSERWDYFTCVRCGVFQYRHRTRKLRLVERGKTQGYS